MQRVWLFLLPFFHGILVLLSNRGVNYEITKCIGERFGYWQYTTDYDSTNNRRAVKSYDILHRYLGIDCCFLYLS